MTAPGETNPVAPGADAFTTLFDAIIQDSGGRCALGVVDVAVARSLARLLSEDSEDAATIARLRSLLPARPAAPARAAFDLSRLSGKDLCALERIASVATGAAAPSRLPRERRSRRDTAAAKLARLLDAVEQRDGVMTEAEKAQVRGHIGELLAPVTHASLLLWPQFMERGDGAGGGEAASAEGLTSEPLDAADAPSESDANVLELRPVSHGIKPQDQGAAGPSAAPWRDAGPTSWGPA